MNRQTAARNGALSAGPTPASLGYRMPAEWEPHEATWLGWPHNPTDWPDKLGTIQWVYGEIVRALVPGEIVRIIVKDSAHEVRVKQLLRRVGVNLKRVQFFRWPTNRGWTRDFGPICVKRVGRLHGSDVGAQHAAPATGLVGHGFSRDIRGGGRPKGASAPEAQGDIAVVKFGFTGWAKYPDWRKDDKIAELAAKALKLRVFHPMLRGKRVVLEGGGIDVNGRGTLLTTEECFLDQKTQVRNPGVSRAEMERIFDDYLGTPNVLWLGRGITGDDTHGHVDDLCRFVNPRTVVLCRESNPRDVNYRALEENWERIPGLRLEDGSKLEALPLPMPAPLAFDGIRLPASYANFYIGNAAVIVPTFNDPNDRKALGLLAECFPDRRVVGIHAVDLVWGFGTLHCLTQQHPAGG